MIDVFDLGDPRYIAQVLPELHPEQPQPRLANWPTEEREMYCGEYTPGVRQAYREALVSYQFEG